MTITIKNPVIWADVPDPSVIRVDQFYYMVSTSMHSMPGCPIMKSVNLRDWELVSYLFDTFEENDGHQLLDETGIYGKGSWATSLRYHEGIYYVCFSSNDMKQFYVYRTDDIEHGKWDRSVIQGLYHDPSLLFDGDRVFVVYGNGNIHITELNAEVTALQEDGINQLLLEGEREGINLRIEGCHAYKLNGYYYLFFIEWPSTGNLRRRQLCYRSRELLGPYEYRVVLDDDMGYFNQGVAQGGIIDSTAGEWFTFLFQDHGSVGRVPCVLPVQWEEEWPVFGLSGAAPQSFEAKLPDSEQKPLVISDEFNYKENRLALNWQWNHNPEHELWSVTEKPGWLRLHTSKLARSVEFARNTLTQRTEGPACSAITLLDSSMMKSGDYAGLVALQSQFGTVGIEAGENGERRIVMSVKGSNGNQVMIDSHSYIYNQVYLKIDFDFRDSIDQARFYYSDDGIDWKSVGKPLQMRYSLEHFMGYRIGLFHYATREIDGYADFDYFHYSRAEQ